MTRIVAAVVGALVLGLVPSPSAAATPGAVSIAILGDSYSAGNGAGEYAGVPGCRQSPHSYGRVYKRLLERQRQAAAVTTAACSGAVIADVTTARRGRPAQLGAVTGEHDLVLLTLGGNDAGFTGIVAACLVPFLREGARCDAALTTAEQRIADGGLEARLRAALEAIRAKADPRARIVVLGYPNLEGDPAFRVPVQRSRPAFTEAGKRLRALGEAADRLQERAVAAVDGAVFVSTRSHYAGHELTAEHLNRRRWVVQPFTDAGLADFDLWYHPNREGHFETAELLLADRRVPKSDLVP